MTEDELTAIRKRDDRYPRNAVISNDIRSKIMAAQDRRDLLAEVDRLRAQVADVEALLRNDDYDPYVHANEGCQGEPDCARCWADDVRNALRGHRD